jgi:tRNA(fMet)-specific endonuclease VapC
MSILLDSSVCIRFLNQRHPRLIDRLVALDDAEILVCSVVKAELWFGAAKSRAPLRSRRIADAFFSRYVSLPFDDAAADAYGSLRADLERSGRPIGPQDLLIAAIAVANDLTLATCNAREFNRVPGLTLEDWGSSE